LELVARVKPFLIETAWSPAKAGLLEHVASRPVEIDRGDKIVTFTFDDVPRSAVVNAAPVLDEHRVRATFYVALGMSRPGREFLGEEDVRKLAKAGHDIGCHTLTHYSLKRGSAQGLYEDARAGKEALESALAGRPVEHFSWPYGAVTAPAKALLRGTFATMRTSTPGVNRGRVDLNYLRALALYSRRPSETFETAQRAVRTVRQRGGWLILYTHGVCEDPGMYDIRCDDFRRVVGMVMESGVPVFAVSEAVACIADRTALTAADPRTRRRPRD
jgi:peptidoglycan/xylan/chitin deacetylase (PgdA/CDA1 family)